MACPASAIEAINHTDELQVDVADRRPPPVNVPRGEQLSQCSRNSGHHHRLILEREQLSGDERRAVESDAVIFDLAPQSSQNEPGVPIASEVGQFGGLPEVGLNHTHSHGSVSFRVGAHDGDLL
jgi:hypothetical protein